jgi:hypothetical protein
MVLLNVFHACSDQFRQSFIPVSFQDLPCGIGASSFVMHRGHKNSAPNKSQHKNPSQSAQKMFELFVDSAAFWCKFCRNI